MPLLPGTSPWAYTLGPTPPGRGAAWWPQCEATNRPSVVNRCQSWDAGTLIMRSAAEPSACCLSAPRCWRCPAISRCGNLWPHTQDILAGPPWPRAAVRHQLASACHSASTNATAHGTNPWDVLGVVLGAWSRDRSLKQVLCVAPSQTPNAGAVGERLVPPYTGLVVLLVHASFF